MSAARAIPRKVLSSCERQHNTDNWLPCVLGVPEAVLEQARERVAQSKVGNRATWFAEEDSPATPQHSAHRPGLRALVCLGIRGVAGRSTLNLKLMDSIALEQLPEFVDKLVVQLDWRLHSTTQEQQALYERFRACLLDAKANATRLIADLRAIAAQSGKLADDMDFKFLLNKHRRLVSVGFDVDTRQLNSACYDLLGTESRTAVFVAIAKEHIPQESWFLLGRAHTLDGGRPVLLSWTGTLFEYLMPSLWMHTYPNTLLERTRVAAVRSQQAYGNRKNVPWGISESAYFKLDEAGNYQYSAFGLPHLALRKCETEVSGHFALLDLFCP